MKVRIGFIRVIFNKNIQLGFIISIISSFEGHQHTIGSTMVRARIFLYNISQTMI